MGMSSTAILAYGYDLGGDEYGWNFPDLDYGAWRPSDLPEDEGDEFEFAEWAESKLLRAAGLDDADTEDYFDRKREARGRVGVEVIHGGNYDYFRVFLVAWSDRGYGGQPGFIDFNDLERRRVREGWDAKLDSAIEVLELPKIIVPGDSWEDVKPRPEQRPHWMLTSFYG